MKLFRIAVSALLLSHGLLSCTKNNDTITPASINNTVTSKQSSTNGIWTGEYKTTSRSAAIYFSFDLKPGSQLFVLNELQEIIGVGSWAMNDSTFNAFFMITATQHAHSVSGALTCPTNLAGKWQFDNNYQDGGTWFLNKVQ